jgi:uncharacterized protein YndB with AHSA1/START domain
MEFQHEIEIDRSPADVFDVLTDPEQLSSWQTTTVAVKRDRQGPLVVGERFDEVHRAMGRETPSTVEVVDFEPGKLFALRIVSGPLPLDGRWELSPTASGTRLTFTGEARSPGLMRLAKPMVARQFRGYHKRLKALLEHSA